MTARDLITRAMHRLGYLEATETPRAADVSHAFEILNDWIDALAAERVTIYYSARQVLTLVSGQASYTIGTGGDFAIARPMFLDGVGVILDATATDPVETPIREYTVAEFQSISQKSADSTAPTGIFYDRRWNAGLGTITVYPVPNVSTARLVLYVPTPLTEFATVDTAFTLAPGWRRFVVTNLAIELAPLLGAVVPPELAVAAAEAKAIVKEANFRPVELTVDPLLTAGRGRFNIETGDFR